MASTPHGALLHEMGGVLALVWLWRGRPMGLAVVFQVAELVLPRSKRRLNADILHALPLCIYHAAGAAVPAAQLALRGSGVPVEPQGEGWCPCRLHDVPCQGWPLQPPLATWFACTALPVAAHAELHSLGRLMGHPGSHSHIPQPTSRMCAPAPACAPTHPHAPCGHVIPLYLLIPFSYHVTPCAPLALAPLPELLGVHADGPAPLRLARTPQGHHIRPGQPQQLVRAARACGVRRP